jgi:uncharacterized protein YndB with AHSA1/START domain
MIEPIRKTIEVPCDAETAFDTFVARTSAWWPLAVNSVSAMSGQAAKSVTIEPRAGGRIFEVKADGATESWGSVTLFERPRRIVLSWQIMVPADQATEVELTFTPTAGGTRVDLEHRDWDSLADQAEASRDSYDQGWVGVFEERFAAACAA